MAERTVKGRTVVIVIAALVVAAVVAAAALSDVRRSILESNPSPKKSSIPKQFRPPGQ